MRRLAAVLLTVAAIAAAGCGEEESRSSEGSAQEAPAAPRDSFPGGPPEGLEDFQKCLADRGVELPEPGEGGAPPSGAQPDENMREAFEACQDELPEELEGAPGTPAPLESVPG